MQSKLEIAIFLKREEINRHYWRFTRQARGNPPPAHLYKELSELEDKLKTQKKVGKPLFYKKPMKRVNVMLDDETIKFYTEHGGGNLSEGIRRHWRGLTQREPDSLKAGESCLPDVVKSESNLPA
jgi:hypothetical protein